MQADGEHRVVYRAVADFADLDRAVARSMAQMAALRAASAQVGPAQRGSTGNPVADMAKQLQQSRDITAATNQHRTAADADATATQKQGAQYQQLAVFSHQYAVQMSAAEAKRRETVGSLHEATTAENDLTAAVEKGTKARTRSVAVESEATKARRDAAARQALELAASLNEVRRAGQVERDETKRTQAQKVADTIHANVAIRESDKTITADLLNEMTLGNAQTRENSKTAAQKRIDTAKADREEDKTRTQVDTNRQNFAQRALLNIRALAQGDFRTQGAKSTAGAAEARRVSAVIGTVRAEEQLHTATANTERAISSAGAAEALRGARVAKNARDAEGFAAKEARAGEQHILRLARMGQALDKNRGNIKGFSDEFLLAFRGIRTGFRAGAHEASNAATAFGRVRARVKAIKAEFASGGGSGGVGGRFFNELGDMANRVATRFSGAFRAILSGRGVIILAVAAAGPLIAALGSLAAGAIGLADTLVSLSGVVFALPALFGAAATSIIAMIIAIKPLKDALTAYGATQKAARHTSQQFIDSQREERRAQLALNEARKQATRDLEDLRRQLERTGLNEDEALLRVKQAKADYERVWADPNATALDREEVVNRVREAEFDYGDTLTKNKRVVEDYNTAVKQGVNGNPAVVDANERVTKSQKEMAAGGSEAYTAQQKLQAELAKLGPNTRLVALALMGQADGWTAVKKAIGDRFFGPLVGQLGHLPGLLILIKTLLGEAAGAVGDVLAKGIAMISRPEWKADLTAFAEDNGYIIRTLGDAVLYIVDAIRNTTMAAAPFTKWLVNALTSVAKAFDDWSASARGSGSIAKFLDGTKHSLHDLWEILKNLFGLFGSLFGASQDFATSMLDGIVTVTDKWAHWGKTQERQGSSFKNWLANTKPLLRDLAGFAGALATAIGAIAADPKNIEEAKKIFEALATKVLPALVGIFHDLSDSHAISDIVTALGNLLEAVKNFLDNGGALPITIFIGSFLGLLTLLASALNNPVLANGFTIFLTFLAALAAASAIGKFLGLFKLYDLFRVFKPATSGVGRAADAILGRGASAGSTGAAAGAAALDGAAVALDGAAAVWRGVAAAFDATMTAVSVRLNAAGALLLRAGEALIGAAEISAGKGVIPSLSGGRTRLTPANTRGAVDLAGPAVGGAAEEGAAVALRGSALALDGAAEQLIIAAGVLREAGLLGGIPLGGKAGKAGKGALAAGEREGVALAEGAGAAKAGSWLSRLFGRRGATVAAGAVAAGGVAEAAAPRLLPRLLGGAVRGLTGPVSLAGLAVGLLADSGLLGKPKSAGATTARAGGAILTGAGIGAGIGSVVPGVGTAIGAGVGAAAGAVYSFVKDPQLRKDTGDFFAMLGGFFKYLGTKAWGWFDNHVIHPVVHFFVGVGGFFKDIGVKTWQWFDTHVVHPVVHFFVAIGDFFKKVGVKVWQWFDNHVIHPIVSFFVSIGTAVFDFARNVGKFIYDHFARPILAIFIGIGVVLWHLIVGVGKWIYDHVVKPFVHFLVQIAVWVAVHAKKVPGWILDHVVRPVVSFFVTVGLWIGRHAKSIGVWIYQHVIRPVVSFFTTIGLWIGRQAKNIGVWIYQHVIVPIVNFFVMIGRWIGGQAKKIGVWMYDHIIVPIVDFFVGIGKWIGTQVGKIAGWLGDHIVTPVVDFFVGIGKGIADLAVQAATWFKEHVYQPVLNFFSGLAGFFVNLPSMIEKKLENVPIIGPAIKKAFNELPGEDHSAPAATTAAQEQHKGHASGGLIAGTADGRTDTKHILATIGEYVIRKRVVDQPGAKRLLNDLNEGRLDPASLYAGFGAAAQGANQPTSRRMSATVGTTTVTNTSTRNAGMSLGDITINNPVREPSGRSLRRTLQTLTYMTEH